jgi:Cu2+-exporting ATPase
MDSATDCFHCGEPVPVGTPILTNLQGVEQRMCCIGCKAVAEFIDSSGLTAFYNFRDAPSADLRLTPIDTEWRHYDSDGLLNRYVHAENNLAEATVDIGGMYCTACVWLFDNALQRLQGIESASVNPATHRAVIRWYASDLKFS